MGFFEYIDYLRSKPERTRTRIAFSVSFIITACIFTAWMMSFYTSQQEDTYIAQVEAVEPISALSGTAVGTLDTIKEGFKDLKNAFLGLFDKTYKAPESHSFDSIETQLFEY